MSECFIFKYYSLVTAEPYTNTHTRIQMIHIITYETHDDDDNDDDDNKK